MNAAARKNIEAQIKCATAGASTVSSAASAITAAGTGDNTKVTGESIDRLGYDSCALAIGFFCTLTADKTFSLAAEYQTSADNSTWATAVALYAATAVASATGAQKGVKETALDLSGLPRYIRFNITPDLSHSGTDVAEYVAIAVLGGATVLPAA